jgi:hypothetical protein
MHIWLRGWTARIFLIVCAIIGFLTALAFVADFYTAYWVYCVPATLLYAAGLWIFATPKAGPGDGLTEVFFGKLFVTIIFVAMTFGAIAAVIFVCTLVADNWPYVVLAALIIVGIVVWALIAGALDERRARQRGEAPENPLER